MRGTTDYWVNDILGQPFFAVERTIDHGLLEVLKSDIVPRLLKDVPSQPTEAELAADRYRARFVILFDREGYSPEFFKEMWQTHRIACITYHKYPKDDWPAAEFAEVETTLPGGEPVKLKLAERGTWIGDRKNGLWVRETRKLTTSGHQVSLISTAFGALARQDSIRLFSRWSQENFFRYMMQHFAIDLLNEYGIEEIPETKRPVVNPKWRELDRRKRSVKSKLTHRQARFAALTLHPESDEACAGQMGEMQSRIGGRDRTVRKGIDGHRQRVEEDARPPRVGRDAGNRKVPALGPQPQATGGHRQDDCLPRRDGVGFNRA